jgi:hypothetical protein
VHDRASRCTPGEPDAARRVGWDVLRRADLGKDPIGRQTFGFQNPSSHDVVGEVEDGQEEHIVAGDIASELFDVPPDGGDDRQRNLRRPSGWRPCPSMVPNAVRAAQDDLSARDASSFESDVRGAEQAFNPSTGECRPSSEASLRTVSTGRPTPFRW